MGSDRSGVWSPTISPTSLSLGYSAGLASAPSSLRCLVLASGCIPIRRAAPTPLFFASIDCFLLVLFLASDTSGAKWRLFL